MKPGNSPLGFLSLNIASFGGAANDNILKQVLIFGVAAGGIWKDQLGEGAQAYASLCLAVPFVLLSGFAGQFSDRYSKRSVVIVVKVAEIAIALLAMWGLWLMNLWIVLTSMILISVQSAFFTPAKFGTLAEIVEEKKLSRANGIINMFTYIAIIFGGAIGGPIYDLYAPSPPDSKAEQASDSSAGELQAAQDNAGTNEIEKTTDGSAGIPFRDESEALSKSPELAPLLWLPGAIILLVALLGTVASFGVPRLVAKNPQRKIGLVLLGPYLETWRDIQGTPLRSVIIAWSYFYFIVGGFAILIIPDYKDLLQISATHTSILMAVLGISIGLGDGIAGWVSKDRIRPELIRFGAIGTTVMFFLLGFTPQPTVSEDFTTAKLLNYVWIMSCMGLAGFFAGFVMVPLQTLTQQQSSEEKRGRNLGLWSCGSFVGIIIGNVFFLLVKNGAAQVDVNLPSYRMFIACGAFGLILLLLYDHRWKPIFHGAAAKSAD